MSLIGKVATISGILLALFLGLVISIVYPIFKVNRPPPLQNPNQIVTDCQSLVEMRQRGELKLDESDKWTIGTLSKEQWPSSISALKPRGIYVLDDRVSILISTGGIGPSYGYLIPYLKHTNYNHIGRGRFPTNGIYISKTKFQNIFNWSTIE